VNQFRRRIDMAQNGTSADFGAVVIGAGFSGLYMLRRLRDELEI